MMKIAINLLLLLSIGFNVSAQNDLEIYPVLDVEPSFPGGIDSMNAFLERTIVYPKEAMKQGIEGKSYLTFMVGVDGTIQNVKVIRPLANCPACDQEAIRAVNLMPKWIPGQLNSKVVTSKYTLPVKFKIQQQAVYEPYTVKIPNEDNLPPIIYPDEPAAFPGGMSALKKYLADSLVYPKEALELKIEGKCITQFVVTDQGAVSNPILKRGMPDCPECDAEALRLVKSMPKWKPAMLNGKAIESTFNLPISFKIPTKP